MQTCFPARVYFSYKLFINSIIAFVKQFLNGFKSAVGSVARGYSLSTSFSCVSCVCSLFTCTLYNHFVNVCLIQRFLVARSIFMSYILDFE